MTLSVAALVVLGGLTVTVSRSALFAVTDVVVVGVDGPRADAVLAIADVRVGTNLLDVDLGTVERRVRALPWVKDVDVGRRPPSTVELAVAVRRPAAVVHVGDAAWVVDGDGVVLAGGAPAGLPVVAAPNSVLPGVGVQVSDLAVRNALAVHAALPVGLRARVDRYDAPSERGLRLHLVLSDDADGVWVAFGAADRVGEKADVVAALLATARDQAARQGDATGLGIAELDVRAPDNPVLIPAE